VSPSPLVQQVLAGGNRDLTLLAARGMLPLPPSELVALQVTLAATGDEEVVGTAVEALNGIDGRVLVPFLQQEAGAEVLRWFAAHSHNREVIESLLRRRDVPIDVLLQLAPRLPADLQEILLLRQDRIASSPELLIALEANPQLTSYSARRIIEYREHLLPGEAPQAPPPSPWSATGELIEAADPEVAEALATVRAQVAEGEIEERTGLSEGQIRLLPVPVRLKLARGAPKTLRMFLVRDNSPQVALTVLHANPVSEQEIEQFAKMRNVAAEVLDYIGKQRQWIGKYPVVLSLVNNPRTPLAMALQLLSRVAVRDLRLMAKDRNLPEAVRSAALRLYRVKSA
jgi:hypothetical protein